MPNLSLREHLKPIFPQVDYYRNETEGCVQTHCLYFDGSNVVVSVKQCAPLKWKISDDYLGLDVVRDHFFDFDEELCRRHAVTISQQSNAQYRMGEWYLIANDPKQLIGGILIVANASQRWAEKMLSNLLVK